jgi:hypothetical protein
MTANYFLITRGGLTLDGALYPPLVQGSGPVTRNVTDNRQAVRMNRFTDPKLAVGAGGWTLTNAAWSSGRQCIVFTPTPFTPATATFTLTGLPPTCRVSIQHTVEFGAGAAMRVLSEPGGFELGTTLLVGYAAHAETNAIEFTPNLGQAYIEITVPYGSGADPTMDLTYCGEPGAYFDGSTADTAEETYSWDGAANASTSTAVSSASVAPSVITGVPADLAGVRFLWHGMDTDIDNPPEMTMPWPGGFYRSVFRVARDPSVVSDDSGNTLGTQIYNHGWVLAERLAPYFKDVRPDELVWPLPSDLAVVPVTGAPAATDSKGWNGMQSVTWPGSTVGVGTIRQILAGDEGSTRQVGVILDRLAALNQAGRDTIAAAFTPLTYGSATQVALANLHTAAGTEDGTSTQKKFWGRVGLNAMLAKSAVSITPDTDCTGNSVGLAAAVGLYAVTALEAGLVGATFTSANYQTLTDAIDAGIVMPSGY